MSLIISFHEHIIHFKYISTVSKIFSILWIKNTFHSSSSFF
nr:MAG TPA: hypothetical protein [Caudoviricetes sp.]